MANANRPTGFTPHSYLNGAPWNGQARVYSIAAAYGTALYIGDPVISSGTSDAYGIQGVAIGAGSGGLRGVIVGLFDSGNTTGTPGGNTSGYTSNPSLAYRPASHANVWYAMVVDDPAVCFTIQEESNGTALAAVDIGLNTITVVTAGNGYTSGWLLRSSTGATPATTATLQVKLLGLVQLPAGLNVFGAYAKHLVQINVHELGHGTGSLGI